MDKPARVEIGEKLYVTAFMVILWADMVLTIVRNGLHFSWANALLGAAAIPVLLYLGNWLFSGNRTARTATLIFIAVQLALALLGILGSPGLKLVPALVNVNQEVGPYCASLGTIRLLLYAGWGAMLLYSPAVRHFLAHQRGESLEEEKETVSITPTGTAVALSEAQFESVGALGGLLKIAAFVAIAAGALQLIGAVKENSGGQVIEAAWLLALGVLLLSPAASLSKLGVAGADMAYLTHALHSLAAFFKRQLVIVATVAAILLVSILFAVL